MELYFNSEIFTSDGDYVIGGIHSSKGATYAEVRMQMEERLKKLIKDFILRSMGPESEIRGEDVPSSEILQIVRDILKDNLHIDSTGTTVSGIAEDIINSPQITIWFSGVKKRFADLSRVTTYKGFAENNFSDSSDERRVSEMVSEATFEQVIEQISMIEV